MSDVTLLYVIFGMQGLLFLPLFWLMTTIFVFTYTTGGRALRLVSDIIFVSGIKSLR